MNLITESQVVLDLKAESRNDAISVLAAQLVDAGRCNDHAAFIADVYAREAKAPTGVPGGLAIPHARSSAITEPSLVIGRSAAGIDWGAKDGNAHLVFLMAAPAGGDADHLAVLAKLSRALMKEEFTSSLKTAKTAGEIVSLVTAALGTDLEGNDHKSQEGLTIVAVTSCATGIAHTFMAAEALEKAANEAGYTLHVETQGATGAKSLDPALIARADAVILAHDVEVRNKERFDGKPVIDVPVKKAISDASTLLTQAAALAAEWKADPSRAATIAAASRLATKVDANAGLGTRIRQWLMTGVSYMIPFVAAGGILIGLAFMISQFSIGDNGPVEIVKYGLGAEGDYNIAQHFDVLSATSWAALMFVIGAASFGFLVPILSGFIAFAIADRPGLAPGIVGGVIAANMGAGFLGGIATGIIAGFVAKWAASWNVPKGVRGIMPVVVIPLVATFITAGLFITLLGNPIAALSEGLTDWLNGLTGASVFVLGAILGAMMGFDLGGPVNKVAYGFATAGLSAALADNATDGTAVKIMAAVMAAGMVAPLAMALATAVRPKLFTEPERENGKAAWLLGASFISEGAIPFAAADPVRVIAASVFGSAITGGLTMVFGATLLAPHGGIWVLPLIGDFWLFLIALIAGVVLMALIVVVLKSARRTAAVAA